MKTKSQPMTAEQLAAWREFKQDRERDRLVGTMTRHSMDGSRGSQYAVGWFRR